MLHMPRTVTSPAASEPEGAFALFVSGGDSDHDVEPDEQPETADETKKEQRKLKKSAHLGKRKPRKPEWKRARTIYPTGEFIPGRDIPLPHVGWNKDNGKFTGASVEVLRKIAADRDRDLMMRYHEVFRNSGALSYEIKDEYAWILLLRKDDGELHLTEEQLARVFPEWQMVLTLKDTGEEPGTKACVKKGSEPAKRHGSLSGPNPPSETQPVNFGGEFAETFTRRMADLEKTIVELLKEHRVEIKVSLESIHSSIRSRWKSRLLR